MSQPTIEESYDELPYPELFFAQSHPNRQAAVATLFGVIPPVVEHCRVLELGCATGTNVMSMASQMPAAEFLGIDLSNRQIGQGREIVSLLELNNVQLKNIDLLEFPQDAGGFDYIIAHGVFSWVPPHVQDGILSLCKRHLNPNGLAYISYNVLPGWHTRGLIREMMLYRTRGITDPLEKVKVGTGLISFLADSVPRELTEYREAIHENLQIVKESSAGAGYVYHEFLERENHPLYFHEFAERAAQHGLQFLSEARPEQIRRDLTAPKAREVLREIADDPIKLEQYLDFLMNRSFRETLLCHDDVEIDRRLSPSRVEGMSISGDLQCASEDTEVWSDDVLEFSAPKDVTLQATTPTAKATLQTLQRLQPQAVSFDELCDKVAARLNETMTPRSGAPAQPHELRADVAQEVLQGFLRGGVQLHVYQPKIACSQSERPAASSVTRFQAVSGRIVSNQRHEAVEAGPLMRRVLGLMDGTRTRSDMVEELLSAMTADGAVVQRSGRVVTDVEELREICTAELARHLASALKSAAVIA